MFSNRVRHSQRFWTPPLPVQFVFDFNFFSEKLISIFYSFRVRLGHFLDRMLRLRKARGPSTTTLTGKWPRAATGTRYRLSSRERFSIPPPHSLKLYMKFVLLHVTSCQGQIRTLSGLSAVARTGQGARLYGLMFNFIVLHMNCMYIGAN